MKMLKKSTAILLCIAMLFSLFTIGSFALETGDTVNWSGVDWSDDYLYNGTLNEGTQYIDFPDGTIEACYEFTAEEDGYYAFTTYADEISYFGVAESYSGNNAKDYISNIQTFENTKHTYIQNFSKGTYLIFLELDNELYNTGKFTIEYIAESISDIEFEKEIETDFILGEDAEKGNISPIYLSDRAYTIKFSNGKTITINNESVTLTPDKPWAKGENTAAFILPGFRKEFTVTLHEITDFVKEIEIPNIDNYLVSYEWYCGYGYPNFGETPEDVIVTYTDGTKKTFEYYYDRTTDTYNTYITLPIGTDIHLNTYHTTNENNKIMFIADIADHTYISEECEIRKVGLSHNLSELKERISEEFDFYYADIEWALERLMNSSSFDGFIYYMKFILGVELLMNIINEVSEFFEYYI